MIPSDGQRLTENITDDMTDCHIDARLFVGGVEVGWTSDVSVSGGLDINRDLPTTDLAQAIPLAPSGAEFKAECWVSPELLAPAEFVLTFKHGPPAPKPIAPTVIHVPAKKRARVFLGLKCPELEVTEAGFLARGVTFCEIKKKASRRERRALWPSGSRGMSYRELTMRHPLI